MFKTNPSPAQPGAAAAIQPKARRNRKAAMAERAPPKACADGPRLEAERQLADEQATASELAGAQKAAADKLAGAQKAAAGKLAGAQKIAAGKAADAHKLTHELQAHQLELEQQNGALQAARDTAEAALERATELFDLAPIAYFDLGADGAILKANFRGELLLGAERVKAPGEYFAASVSREYRPLFQQFLAQVFASDGPRRCEVPLWLNGQPLWVAIQGVAAKTRATCLAAVLDIQDRKRREQDLQLAATVYLALEEAIMVADAGNRIVAVNPAFTRLSGYAAEEAIGRPTSLLRSDRHDQAFYQAMWDSLAACGQWQGEIWNRRKNGEVFLEWLSISTVYGEDNKILQRVAMLSDMSDKKKAEEILFRQANIDSLTGLPNRRLFLDRLQQAIIKARRSQQKLALMFLDLDYFKEINDTLGHDMGDALLREVSRRLQACLRESDTLARPGGDEFTIVMGELDEFLSIERVAQGVIQSMAAPFHLGCERCHVSFSIGIALYPDDAAELDELLKKADQAMYSAKEQGRGRFCYFTPAMQESAESRTCLAEDLRGALAGRQFSVAYQPIVDLASGAICKAEALLRWQHPTRGLVGPAEFIPLAEETGLIDDIGEWIFREAVKQAGRWRKNHHAEFQISVNKSPLQFHNNGDRHVEWFNHLQDVGLPADCIAVEITEALLLDSSPRVAEKLLAFTGAGMQIALDNFGTGYAALSYLKKFHLDYLKIDQSFVHGLAEDPADLALCEAIILMAHKLGMKAIAEGVETKAQRDLLREAGCDYGQGYLFSEPLAAAAFEKLLQAAGARGGA